MTIPLQLRGVVALKSGDAVPVVIGEGAEPKLVITDLLPHLGAEQNRKPLGEAIPAETLNILLGSRPIGDADDKERVKLAVMDRLHEKYGITEDDFVSAELEAVPAADATDIGIDASLIGAYGHDDRVCAYAALQALFDLPRIPERTAVCMLADKEEIGSMGVTGMQSAAFDTFMQDLCEGMQTPLRVCYEQSFCLSADVTAFRSSGLVMVAMAERSMVPSALTATLPCVSGTCLTQTIAFITSVLLTSAARRR